MLYGSPTASPSPNRRSSIERLQRASRVKNSNILALEQKQEYDPTRIPQIERPLAKVQGNGFTLSGSLGSFSLEVEQQPLELSRSDSKSSSSIMSPSKIAEPADSRPVARRPSKDQASPSKSSLSPSKFKSSLDFENGPRSLESSFDERSLPNGQSLHRHAKSVTFDAAPPQVNEYEMATPDLSSVGTNSREGSYESIEDEDESGLMYSPAHIGGHEDSFDASLEDTEKTPVVGPDDWRGDSSMARGLEGIHDIEGSPMPENAPCVASTGRSSAQRQDSSNSNGEHRPLPPLPGISPSNGSKTTSPGLSVAAEKMLGSRRHLPSPPPASASKSDIQNFGNGNMTLEERLKLMMSSDDNDVKAAAEQQRERRLRRGGGRERITSPASEPDESALEAQEADDTVGDISGLYDYQLPSRISRESIMRRVNGNKATERQSDFNFSSPPPSSSPQRSPTRSPGRGLAFDPDVPIPSTEDGAEDEGSVIITPQPYDEDDFEIYEPSEILDDDEERLPQPGDDDDESHYSSHQNSRGTSQETPEVQAAEEEPMTPRANTYADRPSVSLALPLEELISPNKAEPKTSKQTGAVTSVPQTDGSRLEDARAYLQRPFTPDQPMSKPEYDGSGWGEPEEEEGPGTPDSVIHHPVPGDAEQARESPAIPERYATIKASGTKLKTRLSGTPSDLAAMREARRQVSHEVPEVPPIPEKHRNRLSRDLNMAPEAPEEDFLERHPSFKKRSLTLDLDLGLSLDQDFDRVMESQKVFLRTRINTNRPNDSSLIQDFMYRANVPMARCRIADTFLNSAGT